MAETVHIDIETYSECNLKHSGAYRYAEDESTEILCLAYAFDSDPVHLWVPDYLELPIGLWLEMEEILEERFHQGPLPADLVRFIEDGGECRAHNAAFERTVLNRGAGKRIGFPQTHVEQWICTMAKCSAHSIPAALGKAAKALGTHPKDETGKTQMLALSKPRKGKVRRWTPENAPERFKKLYLYNVDDVEAERGVDQLLPDLTGREQEVYWLDQQINDRGIQADLETVDHVLALTADWQAKLDDRCIELTGVGASKREKLVNWIRENGVVMPSMQKEDVADILKLPSTPKDVRNVLRMYQSYNKASVKKYPAIKRAHCEDGRLRGMFVYHGAGPGRWTSRIVQLQNLASAQHSDYENAIKAYHSGDIEWVRALYGADPMDTFSKSIRNMLIAGPGRVLIVMDFSAIEARLVAWLAGAEEVLQVFRSHGKIYEYQAAKIYHLPNDLDFLMSMADTHPRERFGGKVAVLALGYEGGSGAVISMARKMGVDMELEFAEQIKTDWREANPEVAGPKGIWRNLNKCAIAAIQNPGHTYSANKLKFRVINDFLYMRLPSGRRLAYYKPLVKTNRFDKPAATYMGIDTHTRQYKRCDTYGGRLLQNACEGIARDLLVNGMFNLEGNGFPVIGTVHDEAIIEADLDHSDFDLAHDLFCDTPGWSAGLPVKAAGFVGQRYMNH